MSYLALHYKVMQIFSRRVYLACSIFSGYELRLRSCQGQGKAACCIWRTLKGATSSLLACVSAGNKSLSVCEGRTCGLRHVEHHDSLQPAKFTYAFGHRQWLGCSTLSNLHEGERTAIIDVSNGWSFIGEIARMRGFCNMPSPQPRLACREMQQLYLDGPLRRTIPTTIRLPCSATRPSLPA